MRSSRIKIWHSNPSDLVSLQRATRNLPDETIRPSNEGLQARFIATETPPTVELRRDRCPIVEVNVPNQAESISLSTRNNSLSFTYQGVRYRIIYEG